VSKTASQVTQQPGDQGHAQQFRGATGVSRTDDGVQTRINTGFVKLCELFKLYKD
jgi:hypothetical protein